MEFGDLIERVETYTVYYSVSISFAVIVYFIYSLYKKQSKKKVNILPKKNKNIILNKIEKILMRRVGDYSLCFCIFCFLFITITSVFILISATRTELILKSTGTFLAADILIQIIIAVKHSPLIILVYNYYDYFMGFHKILGWWIIILSIIHTISYIINYSRPPIQNFPFNIKNLIYPPPRLFGTLALITVILIGITSLNCLRQKFYNIFMISHYLYILFIIFTALHRPYFIPYAISIAVIIITDYMIRFIYYKNKYTAGIRNYSDKYIGLYFKPDKIIKPYVGAHVFVYIPSISKFETHPFSIISHSNSEVIELGIKPSGKYTKKIIEYSHKSQLCDIRISGLFGSFGFNYFRYEELVLIAGGIGITPFIGILKELYHNKSTNHCIQSIILVWFCREEIIYDIYKDFIDLCIQQNIDFDEYFPYFMPIVSIKTRPVNNGIFQTVDLDTVFKEMIVYNVEQCNEAYLAEISYDDDELVEIKFDDDQKKIEKKEEEKEEEKNRRIGVVCCGGVSLSNDTWDHCIEFSNENIQIDFHDHSFVY